MPTYRRPRQPSLPKRSRTREVYGTGDDEGRYYRCWNCNFVCDTHKHELGGSDDWAGDEHLDVANLCKPNPQARNAGKGTYLGGPIPNYHVAMRFGADESTAETVRHLFKSDIDRGCPFCGSTNYRGDY